MIIVESIRDNVTALLEEASLKCVLPFYKNLKAEQIETKDSPDDFVTLADRRAEVFISNALMKLIENSKVIGEEASSEDKNYCSSLNEKFVWTVDPIDGTKNFINGNDRFCSMIALLHYGKVVASWIYIPNLAACYFADEYGVQVKYSNLLYAPLKIKRLTAKMMRIDDLSFSASLKYLSVEAKKKVKKNFDILEKRVYIGSVGIEAILVANAKIDFIFYSTTSPWDHAPVDMFNRASGGKTAQVNLIEKTSIGLNFCKKSPILFVRSIVLWDEVFDLIFK